jgi:patatin-like phospholipase/acyl hydrolase
MGLCEAASTYNVLSIDGGGIRGVITVNCIKEMEKFAYRYAVEKGYQEKIPKY